MSRSLLLLLSLAACRDSQTPGEPDTGASDGLVEAGWLPYVCGDPDHVVAQLKPFVEAGGNFFMGGFKCGPMPQDLVLRSMKLFQEEVAPRL